jgi:hypothetical protein
MLLFEWDAPEGDPGQSCVHLFARSYRRLSAQFQFSLSAFTLVYLSQLFIYCIELAYTGWREKG